MRPWVQTHQARRAWPNGHMPSWTDWHLTTFMTAHYSLEWSSNPLVAFTAFYQALLYPSKLGIRIPAAFLFCCWNESCVTYLPISQLSTWHNQEFTMKKFGFCFQWKAIKPPMNQTIRMPNQTLKTYCVYHSRPKMPYSIVSSVLGPSSTNMLRKTLKWNS